MRWLLCVEDIGAQCLCLHTRRVARVLARRYDEALAAVELTNGQFTLLAVLAGQRDIGMKALADAMGMDRTTVTAVLKPLVRRKLVTARIAPQDARARCLQLTRGGEALLRRAIPLWQQVQQDTVDRIGDAAQLRKDLQRLL